tara:strand:- start:385 stop:876 length:492 start_codon:yes stop_codon:yes gene_type:complete
MPLVSATFQGELISIFEVGPSGNPSGKLVGMDISKAYMNYISAGMNAGGFPFSAMPGVSGLGSALGDILDKNSPSGALTAQKMAREFDTCLQTFMSVNQTTIITTAGLGGLISELVDLLSKANASATIFCQGLATAVNNHAMAAIVSGIIPGSPPIPFTGPIS